MTKSYFSAFVAPTYIENWPSTLYKLSIPQILVPLSLAEAADLSKHMRRFEPWHINRCDDAIKQIAQVIEDSLKEFPKGAFIRLGSRSAKDSLFALYRGLRVTTTEEALKMLLTGSQRVIFDLRLALQQHYEPTIVIRQWTDIAPWTEFRCFMKSRKLVGISQYNCKSLEPQPEIVQNARLIEKAIRNFFDKFQKTVHMENVVFDVFLISSGSNLSLPIKVVLLELNPFFLKTDSCLFDWTVENDFDGSFRYVK